MPNYINAEIRHLFNLSFLLQHLRLSFRAVGYRKMRTTALLRQAIAGAGAQRKLPLPTTYTSQTFLRLTQQATAFLPSPINVPTTLPPIFIPPKEIDRTKRWAVAKILYHRAKSYYQFYKAGIKQFNSNRKIRMLLKVELMKQFKNINVPGSANIAMTRSEFQLMIRTKQDWRKMPCALPCLPR